MTTQPDPKSLRYLRGHAAAHESEAIPGALPRKMNTPLEVPFDLYPEQITGTSFVAPRALNRRTWLYKIQASVAQGAFEPAEALAPHWTNDFSDGTPSPELLRWCPAPMPDAPTTFLAGMHTVAGAGSPEARDGLAIHVYAANADMVDEAFYNSDGDMLIAPELGTLLLQTEFGWLHVEPGEFAVVQRGLKFRVLLPQGGGRGFVLEQYNGRFQLPERGPIGANGLADARHFEYPTAAYEDREVEYALITKFAGRFHRATLARSPFDVVAWHGNYAPYKYDIANYNAMGSVSFDHPDPSILTVLTVPRDHDGNAVADVIFFPGRWEVAEDTFRPPYLHRNTALEFSGIVKGATNTHSGYDKGVFTATPGMTAHGIAASSFYRALDQPKAEANDAHRIPDDSLWIMFETQLQVRFTPWAMDRRERTFRDLHAGYRPRFRPPGE